MGEAITEAPAARADRLLRDVLGEAQYRRFRDAGFLDLPSGRFAGRVYRLDSSGNLGYREPGETGFNTTFCVQPIENLPLDDQVAMRYLLVTADEDRLVEVANPITFGLVSLTRALYNDFGQRYSAAGSALLTFAIVAFFLGSLWLDGWTATVLLHSHPILAIILFIVFVVPALIGVVLLAALLFETVRATRIWAARRRLHYPGVRPGRVRRRQPGRGEGERPRCSG